MHTLARGLENFHYFTKTCPKCADWNPPIRNVYIRLTWLASVTLRPP